MLQRTEGDCIDWETIISGFIYLISVLRFLRITNKDTGYLTERIQIWDTYESRFRLTSTSHRKDKGTNMKN